MLALAVALACGASVEPARAASPPGSWNGVIEGFAGEPWTQQQRLATVAWMGSQAGLDNFVYGPVDDPYERAEWRTPWPASTIDHFGDLVVEGRENGVRIGVAITPQGMCLSSVAERQALFDKLQPVVDAGVPDIVLEFDDTDLAFACDADRAQWGAGAAGVGAANADLANEVAEWLRARVPTGRLLVVPIEYIEVGSGAYLDTLGAQLDQAIDVAWTGRYVVPATITARDADAVAARLHRTPVLWDNLPVHDFARTTLHLGPYTGRSADLPDHVAGVLLNPMDLPVASRVTLGTFSRWLQSPATYRPEVAWNLALGGIGQPGLPATKGRPSSGAALRRMADGFAEFGILDDAAPMGLPNATPTYSLLDRWSKAASAGTRADATAGLLAVGTQTTQAVATIRATPGLDAFEAETDGWLQATVLDAAIARRSVELAMASRPRLAARRVTRPTRTTWRVSGQLRPADPARIRTARTALAAAVRDRAAIGFLRSGGGSAQTLRAIAETQASCATRIAAPFLDGRRVALRPGGRFVATTRSKPKRLAILDRWGRGAVTGAVTPIPATAPVVASPAWVRSRAGAVTALEGLRGAIARSDADGIRAAYHPSYRDADSDETAASIVAAWRGSFDTGARVRDVRVRVRSFDLGAAPCGGDVVVGVDITHVTLRPGAYFGDPGDFHGALALRNVGTAARPSWKITRSWS